MSDGLPISRSATSAAKRFRSAMARVNLPDAESWEVIDEGAGVTSLRANEKRPRRAASQAEGKVTAMASGDPDVAAARNWIATSSRECCRLDRPNGLPPKGGTRKLEKA